MYTAIFSISPRNLRLGLFRTARKNPLRTPKISRIPSQTIGSKIASGRAASGLLARYAHRDKIFEKKPTV
jgi:hypothetical protein